MSDRDDYDCGNELYRYMRGPERPLRWWDRWPTLTALLIATPLAAAFCAAVLWWPR